LHDVGGARGGMKSQYVKQLQDGRFILAGWIPRAGLFNALPFRDPPVASRTAG
jgi:hypothetical protein